MLIADIIPSSPEGFAAWSVCLYFGLGLFKKFADALGWAPQWMRKDSAANSADVVTLRSECEAKIAALRSEFDAKIGTLYDHMHKERHAQVGTIEKALERLDDLTMKVSEIVGRLSNWAPEPPSPARRRRRSKPPL